MNIRILVSRIAALFHLRRLDRELSDELAAHLGLQEEEFVRQGMSTEEARARALREFGGVAQTAEIYREQRGIPWFEALARDLRYAARGLARNPGFTAAAVLSLSLGIGANTAIFSMFHALMLRALPVRHAEELVTLFRTYGWGLGYSSYPLYAELASHTELFSGVIAAGNLNEVPVRYAGEAAPETARRSLVSGNYFNTLGVEPALGRLFNDADNRAPHAHPLAVLSYDFWRRKFAGDPSVIGRTVVVENDPLTIIGVAASGFHGVNLDRRADLWEPAMMRHGDVMDIGSNWLWIVGRRRADVTPARLQAAVNVLFRNYLVRHYGNNGNVAFRRMALEQQIEVRDGGIGVSMLREDFGKALTVLLAAVGLVLLAACANLANLTLARGAAKQKEFAVRLSIGATRGHLLRQSLAESVLLAGCGCALGLVLAYWGERAIILFLPSARGNPFTPAPDGLVLMFTLGLGVLSVFLSGLVPAWQSARVDAADSIKSGAGHATARTSRFRNLLVVAQVAFSVMLVTLAGLFAHSLAALRSLDLGFRNQGLIAVSTDIPEGGYERLAERVAAIPGVSMAAFGSPGPYQGGFANRSVVVPGSAVAGEAPSWVNVQRISPRFFEILGSRVAEGREFDAHDGARSRKVALVNAAFLGRFMPGERRPLTRILDFQKAKDDPTYIVGVVPDIPHAGLKEKIEPTVYLPVTQDEARFGAFLLQAARPAAEMAAALRRAGITGDPATIRQTIDDSIFQERLTAAVAGFFGALALVLAAVGLYGVVAYGAARRSREIGIRIAMGAARGRVLWSVLRGAVLLVTAGLAVGLPVSLLAARRVASLLFSIRPDDTAAFVVTACALLITGVIAALGPASRAARMDPMRVLRDE